MKRLLAFVLTFVMASGFVANVSYGVDGNRTLQGNSPIAFSPDGKMLAAGGSGNTIILWDVATSKKIKTLTSGTETVHSVAFSPDGKMLASGCGDGTIILWDTATGNKIKTFAAHTKIVYSVAFSPDGNILASSSYDETIILWEVATGNKIRTITLGLFNTTPVVFSPDGKMLVSVGNDRGKSTIILWDVATWDKIKTLTSSAYSFSVHSVAFSPDGNMLASGGYEEYQYSRDKGYGDNYKGIILWEVSTGNKIKIIKILKGHNNIVTSVSFSPDGSMLAASADNTTILWDVASGNEIKTFGGYRSIFSPDGKLLASIVSSAILLRKWDTALSYEEERKKEEEEREKKAEEEKKKAEIGKKLLYKNFGLTGKLEKDLPKVAHSFRNGMIKARDWKYRIEHKTTSDKIERENEKMLSWFRNEVEPLAPILLDLANQYQARYGDDKLRDFAIKNNFLDVLENRY